MGTCGNNNPDEKLFSTINPSLPTLISDRYSEYSSTLISSGGVRTVTSNVILSNSSIVTGVNLGSFVAAEIAASTNPSHNFFTGVGYPIHPLRSFSLFIVTKTPELKLNFESNSESIILELFLKIQLQLFLPS